MNWKRTLGLGALLCLLLTFTALAAESDVHYVANAGAEGSTAIYLQEVEGKTYLFLPSSADLDNLALWFDGESATVSGGKGSVAVVSGETFSVSALADENDGMWVLTFTQGEKAVTFRVMRSANLRSMYITASDPNKDREWVESAADKNNKSKNDQMVLLRADGSIVYDNTLKNVKGRGNSTWAYPKKPYQIKLNKKTDLLETGDPLEAEGTWVLLANYIDTSLVRNQLTYDLATEFGLSYTPHTAQLDLYYGGEYRGTYQLSEKTQVGKGRVNIRDLEGEIEAANPDVEDFDTLDRNLGWSINERLFQYVGGIKMPEDYTSGYLLELDYDDRAQEEASWFQTTHNKFVVVKSPEYLSREGVLYISHLYQHFEDAVFNGGIDPDTGKHYTEFVDLDSLARCWLMLEISGDTDGFFSSTYFYKPTEEYKLYAGPIWDFDIGYGLYASDHHFATEINYMSTELMSIPSFRNKVSELYQKELYGLLRDVVLSASAAKQEGSLLSLRGYQAQIADSRQMNDILWGTVRAAADLPDYTDIYGFLNTRSKWFLETVTAKDWVGQSETVPTVTEAPVTTVQDSDEVTRAMMVTLLYRMVGSPTPAAKASFPDVAPDAAYADAISWAVERGIFTGYNTGLFGPNDPMSRAQAVTLLGRISKATRVETDAFSDIEYNSWYSGYLGWALQADIIQNDGFGYFHPYGEVTVAELSQMMSRMASWIMKTAG